ncbi:MAG: hypothetical protein FWE55_05075 [Synergistaceae bacterium]|nr:hypothetical protein [Synergistaceae bacterium]
MRIRLDEVELPLSGEIIEEGKQAIFEAARRNALSKKSVIVEIIVDGVQIEDEEAFFSLSGGMDIHFTSQPIISLVRESVEEGQKYIPTLLKGLEGIATLIEEGRDNEAQNSFSQAVEGINWLVGVFAKSCALLGITSENLSAGDWTKDSKELNEVLEEIISIMEGGRSMRMAFVIRERLIPVINKFSSYWSDVSSQLDGPLH